MDELELEATLEAILEATLLDEKEEDAMLEATELRLDEDGATEL